MAIYQLIYTSSKRGYGVFSKSSEIKPDESRQITINTAYKRPQALINSNETNYKKFPVNLSRFRLSNQKWVIAQSAYVGLDNTGRQGNFFTHALLLPSAKEFSKKYLYYPYRDELTDEEKELVNPPALPQVTDFDVSNQATLIFAKENSSKLPLFIQSFLDAQRNRKKLGIEDTNENIILWIRVLFDILPFKLLEELEFTTYTDRITSAFDVVGIYDSSIVKDLTRFINFDGKDNTLEIGSFAKSIVNDYLTGKSKDLFYFFSNSMKREELLKNIDSLYTTLNATDVSIDDVFALIKNLPKNDLSISVEVIQFLLNSDFLMRFDDAQIQYVLSLIEPSEKTTEYNSIIHKIAYSCKKSTLDLVIQSLKPNSKLYQDIDQLAKNDNINYLLLLVLIKLDVSPFKRERFSEIFQATGLIPGTKSDWLKAPFNQLIDQLIMTFPRNDGIHSESDLKSLVIKIKNMVGYETIYERVSNRFRNEMQQMEGINHLAIRNSTLLIALSGESKDIARVLRNYDSKEDQPRLLQVLETIYNTFGESVGEDNTLMTQYKALYPVYEQAFDHLSRGKQKKFIRRYRRVFGNKSNLRYRPNYSLFAIIALAAISLIGTTGYFIVDGQPKLIRVSDQTEISSFVFAKVVNQDNPLFNFEKTPERLNIELADVLMSDYTLSNSGTWVSKYNIRQNRVEYRPTEGNFLSPKFAIQFDKQESDSIPVIFIGGERVIPGSDKTIELDYDQIYAGDVYDMFNEVIGTLTIADDTILIYHSGIRMLGIDNSTAEFNNVNNPDFRRFIDIDASMFDELNQRRSRPLSSEETFRFTVSNHAGQETFIQIVMNINAKNIQIQEEFPYFSPALTNKFSSSTPISDLVTQFLSSLNITVDFDPRTDKVKIGDTLTLVTQSGNVAFDIPINLITSTDVPTIELVDSGLTQIEIDWVARFESDYEELIQDVLNQIGSVIVQDSGLALVFNEELYRVFLVEYLDKDNSLQDVSSFKHPFLDLEISDKSSATVSKSSDGQSFVLQLSVVNIYGLQSNYIDIVVKTPSAAAGSN